MTVSADAPAAEIFKEIAKASQFSIHRLRITKGSDGSPINNVEDVKVHDTGLRNKSAVDVKDLGRLLRLTDVHKTKEYVQVLKFHGERSLSSNTSDLS